MRLIMRLIMKLTYILTAFLAALALSSCEHKELCYHHPHVVKLRLEFDWRDAPDANPAGMCVFFYPEDPSKEVIRFDFRGMRGGEITIPQGRYKMLTYNNDTSGVLFSGMDVHDSHTAFTREGGLFEPVGATQSQGTRAPRADSAEDEKVIICPDMMWGCNAIDVDINEQGIFYICVPESEKEIWIGKDPMHTEYVVTLFPHELTCIYTYEIINVVNIDEINRMTASLSGMSPALRLFHEELDRECITHPFEAVADRENNRVIGRFITFGHHEENPNPHKMMLYVWTNDGKAYSYGADAKFDVTDQVHAAPNRRRVHLIIDGLDIPKPIDPEPPSGLEPDVDDWLEENWEIIL